jgi:hypothetical protein
MGNLVFPNQGDLVRFNSLNAGFQVNLNTAGFQGSVSRCSTRRGKGFENFLPSVNQAYFSPFS